VSGLLRARATAFFFVVCGSSLLCNRAQAAISPTANLFVFDLRGSQGVPPVSGGATGGCLGQLDQAASTLALTCVHNVANATAMHIHRGAPAVNGPIVFDPGSSTSPLNATWAGMTPTDVADLLAGNLYVDVHSTAFPAGEIRGQILPRTVDTVAFTVDGAQPVPPSGSSATANCTADLANFPDMLAIQCTHDLATPTVAHVHEGQSGSNGPIVFTFASPASPLNESMPMTEVLIADFAATFLYLDIHSAGTEIRGQIGQPPPGSADLVLTKSGPATIVAGNPISYTLTVTNNGPNTAQSVTLTDTLPAGTTFVSEAQSAGPAFTCVNPSVGGTGTVSCSIVTLASAASATFTVVFKVGSNVASLTTITNTASVAQSTSDPAPVNNTQVSSAIVSTSANLTVVKTGPATITAGNDISYSVSVTNNGPSDAATITLTDILPTGTTFVSEAQNSGPSFACVNPAVGGTGSVSCSAATLLTGASATFTIVFKVGIGVAGGTTITNIATVAAATADATASDNTSSTSATVSGANADLSITTSTSAGPYGTGFPVTYTFTISNAGPASATGVTVSDTIPAGTAFVSAAPSQGTCAGTSTVTCSLGSIAAGGTATMVLTLTLPSSPGPVSNTATVSSANPDSNATNNSATASIAVIAASSIPTLTPIVLMMLAAMIVALGVMRLT
jgi:uncharacterized repeat protein (TIGR01451 family)